MCVSHNVTCKTEIFYTYACICVMVHMFKSLVTHAHIKESRIHESCHRDTKEDVTSRVIHTYDLSCHRDTKEDVTSRVIHTYAQVVTQTHMCTSHVTRSRMNETCRTHIFKRVTSRAPPCLRTAAQLICAPWLIHTCAMTPSYMHHVWIIFLAWLHHMCTMTHLYVCYETFLCLPLSVRTGAQFASKENVEKPWAQSVRRSKQLQHCAIHDSFICVPWLFCFFVCVSLGLRTGPQFIQKNCGEALSSVC